MPEPPAITHSVTELEQSDASVGANSSTRRWALFALAIGGFAIGTTEFVSMGLLPDIAAGMDVSIPVAGHFISAYALGVVVGAPLLAIVGARMSRQRLLIWLMAGLRRSATSPRHWLPNYPSLLAARFAAGLPHGAFFGVGAVVGASLVAANRRGFAISMMMGGLTVSNIVGVPLGTLLGQAFGWRWPYVVVALLGCSRWSRLHGVDPARPATARCQRRNRAECARASCRSGSR